MAYDRFGRWLHYLRVSLTDHCNLRCIYCIPQNVTFLPKAEIMQDDEVLALVRLFVGLGFDKIRLTGGEPTVHPGIVELVQQITGMRGVRLVSMTSNGILFDKLAEPLARAGLKRVNFSLDTLDPDRFQQLTRRGSIDQVYAGISAAERAGLLPIKINTVVVRNFNDMDAVELARLTLERPWHVRFIEMMPFAGATQLQLSNVVTTSELTRRFEAAFGRLEPVNGGKLYGEARLYKLPGAIGEVGFISTISQPFCASCSRARLTADGKLRLCLLREDEIDLLGPLRAGASQVEMRQIILEGLWRKPWGNRLAQGETPMNRAMNNIGG
jgi:cyclic pyranopterin phosphate synthase